MTQDLGGSAGDDDDCFRLWPSVPHHSLGGAAGTGCHEGVSFQGRSALGSLLLFCIEQLCLIPHKRVIMIIIMRGT